MEEETKVVSQNENQFNFRNIGKAIAKFKWWIIGATLIGTVAGYLVFRLAINPGREQLVSTFGYNINARPKLNENTTYTNEALANETLYLSDSSIFSYTDIVSEERLNAVKEAYPDKFANLNTQGMAKNGGIKISKASYTDQTSGKVIYEYPARYTLTAGKSNFASEQQGKEFIQALIDYELAVAKTANDNFELTDYIGNASTLSYGQYVSRLLDQYDEIDKCYKDLIKEFSASSVATINGETLNVTYNAFQSKYAFGATTLIQQYEGDLYNNHLVDYKNVTVEGLKSQAESYKENVRSNLITLNTYQGSLDKLIAANITNYESNSQLEKEIVKYNEKIVEIKKINGQYVKELINLGYFVPENLTLTNVNLIVYLGDSGCGVIQSLKEGTAEWKALCDEFKVNLDKAAVSLKEDRALASNYYGFVNNRYRNQVNMFTAGTAELTGHVSSFIGAAVGLVVCFILSTFVCTLVYIARKDKYEAKKK